MTFPVRLDFVQSIRAGESELCSNAAGAADDREKLGDEACHTDHQSATDSDDDLFDATHSPEQNHIPLCANRFVDAQSLIEIIRQGSHQLGLSGSRLISGAPSQKCPDAIRHDIPSTNDATAVQLAPLRDAKISKRTPFSDKPRATGRS
jgi:hypothetical protein